MLLAKVQRVSLDFNKSECSGRIAQEETIAAHLMDNRTEGKDTQFVDNITLAPALALYVEVVQPHTKLPYGGNAAIGERILFTAGPQRQIY